MDNMVIIVIGHIGIEPGIILRHAILHAEHFQAEHGIGIVSIPSPERDFVSEVELFSNLAAIIESGGIGLARRNTTVDLVEFAKEQLGLPEKLLTEGRLKIVNSIDEELRDMQYFFERPKNNVAYKHYKWKSRMRSSKGHRRRFFQRKTFPKQIV